MSEDFDVFLSHNSQDKPAVKAIGEALQERGLRPWLDEWELRPGQRWQRQLQAAIDRSKGVAVFVGETGLGPWEEPEMEAFLDRAVRETGLPVIPVLLPGVPPKVKLPRFLSLYTWVDLRKGITEKGLRKLEWGITGKKPDGATAAKTSPPPLSPSKASEPPSGPPISAPRRWRWRWPTLATALAIAGILVSLAAWFWPLPVDPPVVEPAAVKLPLDRKVPVRVESEKWKGAREEITLGKDPSPSLEFHLSTPESWLRGLVLDPNGNPIAGATVSSQDVPAPTAETDITGRFELRLPLPYEARVRVRADHDGYQGDEIFCYAGRDRCSIELGRQ